jgi:hypothetical protein
MNERIMELIEKAGWTNAYTDPKYGFEPVFEGEDRNLACIEKFAELIVKECVDTIADLHTWKTKDNREYPDLWHEGVMKATDHLLQHWGLNHK